MFCSNPLSWGIAIHIFREYPNSMPRTPSWAPPSVRVPMRTVRGRLRLAASSFNSSMATASGF